MAVKKKFSALGRGLDALISTEDVVTNGSDTINEVDIELIEANPNQPRREFNEEALQELADSIAEIGIIQPITLRKLNNGKYQIIAGERRWRASMRAKLKAIPAYIKTVDDENLMEMALVENIQRQKRSWQRRWERKGLQWPISSDSSNCRHQCRLDSETVSSILDTPGRYLPSTTRRNRLRPTTRLSTKGFRSGWWNRW